MGGYDTGPSVGLLPGSDGGVDRGSDAERILRTGKYSPLGGCFGIMPEDAAAWGNVCWSSEGFSVFVWRGQLHATFFE